MRNFMLVVAAGLLLVPAVRGQESKSPAELLPAGTLFYAEVRQPGPLAKEIASLVAGSAFSEVPDSLHKIRAKYPGIPADWRMQEIGAFGAMFSPEVVKELQRLEGAAFAMTGLDAPGNPEFAAIVLPGQSNVLNFFMRMFVTMERVRQVDTVEGVPLYRMVMMTFPPFKVIDPDLKDIRPVPAQAREYGPTFAQMPGLVTFGSTDLVKDIIRRAKGKGKGETLAEHAAFREARRGMDKPGVFAYASGPRIADLAQGRDALPLTGQVVLGMARAAQTMSMNLTLEKGSLTVRKTVALDAKARKQVMELLPGKAVNANLLHYAPRDAVFALVLANPDGEKRWARLLDVVDQALPQIQGRKASDLLKDVQNQIGIDLGKDIVGPITGLAVAVGDPTKATVRRIEERRDQFRYVHVTTEVPLVFIIEAADDKAAEGLAQLLPKVFALMGRGKSEETAETIRGLEIRTLKSDRESLSFGRHGRILVVGPYAGPVLNALLAGEKKQGLLADAQVARRVRELEEPMLVLLTKPVSKMVAGLTVTTSSLHARGVAAKTAPPKFEDKKFEDKKFEDKKFEDKKFEDKKFEEKKFEERKFDDKKVEVKKEDEQVIRTEVVNPPRSPQEERVLKEMGKLFAQEDWFVLGITRKEDRIVAEGKTSGLERTVAQFIDFGVEEAFRNLAERGDPRAVGDIGKGVGKAVFSTTDRLTVNDAMDQVRRGSRCKIFNVKMEPGRTYTIDLVSHKDAFFDNYLRLEDSAGNQLEQNDDGGGGLNARIIFRPTRADTYRIIATSFAGGTGTFTLTVREK